MKIWTQTDFDSSDLVEFLQTQEMSGHFVEINLFLAADGGGKSGFDAIAPDLS